MLKRIKSGLVAMVVGVSMVMAISASAADVADSARAIAGITCGSCNTYTTNGKESGKAYYEYKNDNYHDLKQRVEFTCGNGHKTVVIDILATESHALKKWDDIAHNSSGVGGGSHNYRLICTSEGCGYSRVITIPCSYDQLGYHNTPF